MEHDQDLFMWGMLAFGVVALGSTLVGVVRAVAEAWALRSGVLVQGRVVGTVATSRRLLGGRHAPVVELTTEDGRTVRAVPGHGLGYGERAPLPAPVVDVRYDPADPTRITTPADRSSWPGVLVVLPLPLVLVGWLLIPLHRLGLVRVGISLDPAVAAPVLLGVGFTVIGTRAIASGRRGRREQARLISQGVHVTGVIVGQRFLGDDTRIRVPEIAFRTLDGREVRSWPTFGRTSVPLPAGRVVNVAYDPADPRTIVTDANGSLGGTGGLFTVVGWVFTVAGIGLLTLVLAVAALF